MALKVFSILNSNSDCIEALLKKSKKKLWCLRHQKGIKEGIFSTFIRRGDVLLLTKMSTVVNQIIQIHQTVIML